jgi:hypothetical protein
MRLRKCNLSVFSGSDPLPPKGGTTEIQLVGKSPLGDLGVRQTFRSVINKYFNN